jgi:hypothetical protein
VRALLLKPAALGAAIALGLFGVALMAFAALDAPAANAQSSDCGSPPASSTVITSSSSTTGAGSTSSSDGTDTTTPSDDTSTPSDDTSTPSDDTSTPSDDTSTPSDDTSTTTDPTPTPTSSDSGTPATSPSTSPTPQLCVEVDPYPSSGDVLAGDPASYVVWVWSLDADSSDVTATASVTAASYLGSPSFSICPSASGATCTMASVPDGDVYELLASVPTTTDATPGTDIALTVSVAATGSSPDSESGTDVVVTPTSATSSSDDSSSTVPPLESLPTIPGTGVTVTSPADLFPTVSPSTSSGSLGLPPAKVHHVVAAADSAYAVPVDPRLLGAQLVGLVALAGAITIAIVRLSLRKPLPATPQPADPTDNTVAS